MNKRGIAVLTAVVMVSFAGAGASADWNPVKTVSGWFKSEKQNTLLVTGNYLRPRRLAEIAQEFGGQAILVFARDGKQAYLDEDGKIKETIAKADIAALVQKLAPAKVVVLGDAQYVPQECVDALGVTAPTVLADSDWAKNGATLANMLGEKKLTDAYVQCLADLDGVLQQAPARSKAPVVVPVEPQTASVVEPVAATVAATPAVPAEPTVTPTPAKEKKAELPVVSSPIEPVIRL